MKDCKSSDMHLNNITEWKLDRDVTTKIVETCFGFLVKLQEKVKNVKGYLSLPLNFTNALVKNYDAEAECFRIGKNTDEELDLDFGLQDILFITGLPINGMPVTGIILEDAVQILINHLAMKRNDAEDLLKVTSKEKSKGAVDLKKLRAHFQRPDVSSKVGPEVLAKAFIFYCLGIILFPTRSRTGQPHYLPLLDVKVINNYAWGAAVLADIKSDLAEIVKKEEQESSLSCCSLALIVFALVRFPTLTQEIVPAPNLPTELPLSLGWIEVLAKEFRPAKKRKNAKQLEQEFNNMTVVDITWMPYDSNRLEVPSSYEVQLRLSKYAVAPCINFYSIHMVRPDLCYRQLGLAEDDVRRIDVPKRSLVNPSTNKGMDLKSYAGGINRKKKKKEYNYAELNEMWANKLSYLVYQAETESEESQPEETVNPVLAFANVNPPQSETESEESQVVFNKFARGFTYQRTPKKQLLITNNEERNNEGGNIAEEEHNKNGNKAEDIEHSRYLLREFLPYLKQLSQEEMNEKNIEASIQGLLSLSMEVCEPLKKKRKTNEDEKLEKKLLILDINGVLADVVYGCRYRISREPDLIFGKNHLVFVRQHCREFLKFCFEKFVVAIWSSKMSDNVEKLVEFLFQDMKGKLLFCWDHSYCTSSGVHAPTQLSKEMVFKDLNKVWDQFDDYNAKNTLLVDDSPYKALLNPPHTAVFPDTYKYWHNCDNLLGKLHTLTSCSIFP
ncbi:uncharacterized protein LOC130737086 [Lotus japonicus]|uniref:uncharacterized protein LOC130737086 n=1 Tax=Lotus japonicus TaxID=34305 RepID=UPI002582DB97|nr:uncharacterized protein LOC130737086 [Lotus japonicus]